MHATVYSNDKSADNNHCMFTGIVNRVNSCNIQQEVVLLLDTADNQDQEHK